MLPYACFVRDSAKADVKMVEKGRSKSGTIASGAVEGGEGVEGVEVSGFFCSEAGTKQSLMRNYEYHFYHECNINGEI